jgi:hypothetical protein
MAVTGKFVAVTGGGGGGGGGGGMNRFPKNDIISKSSSDRVIVWDSDRMILSEDDFEIKSKIYSLKLRLILNHILNSQDVLSFQNLFFT